MPARLVPQQRNFQKHARWGTFSDGRMARATDFGERVYCQVFEPGEVFFAGGWNQPVSQRFRPRLLGCPPAEENAFS